jgi:hypothetical protein
MAALQLEIENFPDLMQMLVIELFLTREILPEGGLFTIKELLVVTSFFLRGLDIDLHFVLVFLDVTIVVLVIKVDLGFEGLLEVGKCVL